MKLKPSVSSARQMSILKSWNTRESITSLYNFTRRYLILEDQYKQMESEYNEKKEKIKQMIPSDEDFHQQEVQRRHYLHMLVNEKVRLNDTIGRNHHLKTEINIMRKEIL